MKKKEAGGGAGTTHKKGEWEPFVQIIPPRYSGSTTAYGRLDCCLTSESAAPWSTRSSHMIRAADARQRYFSAQLHTRVIGPLFEIPYHTAAAAARTKRAARYDMSFNQPQQNSSTATVHGNADVIAHVREQHPSQSGGAAVPGGASLASAFCSEPPPPLAPAPAPPSPPPPPAFVPAARFDTRMTG